MSSHINASGLFQSDKYPTCPAGKVPLSVNDKTAQDLLYEYAQRRRSVDAEFSADLETALATAGFACAGCTVGDRLYEHTCSRKLSEPNRARMVAALEACEAYFQSPGMTPMLESDVEFALLEEIREVLGKPVSR